MSLDTSHKNYNTLGLPNVCCVSLTVVEVIDYRAVLLIRCWSVLDRNIGYTYSCSIDYKNYTLSELYALTSNSPHFKRLGFFYYLHLIHMQVCETFLNKKWQTVV